MMATAMGKLRMELLCRLWQKPSCRKYASDTAARPQMLYPTQPMCRNILIGSCCVLNPLQSVSMCRALFSCKTLSGLENHVTFCPNNTHIPSGDTGSVIAEDHQPSLDVRPLNRLENGQQNENSYVNDHAQHTREKFVTDPDASSKNSGSSNHLQNSDPAQEENPAVVLQNLDEADQHLIKVYKLEFELFKENNISYFDTLSDEMLVTLLRDCRHPFQRLKAIKTWNTDIKKAMPKSERYERGFREKERLRNSAFFTNTRV